MAIPSFLSGAAGRAIDDMLRVRGAASATKLVFDGVVDGTTTAAHGTHVLGSLDQVFRPGNLRGVVTDARPGLRAALGSGQTHASGTMHARLGELASARGIMGMDDARAVGSAAFGARSATSLLSTIDGVLPQLQGAARRTAATRIALGAVGLGAAAGGVALLARRSEDDSIPMAPGPIGERRPAGQAA